VPKKPIVARDGLTVPVNGLLSKNGRLSVLVVLGVALGLIVASPASAIAPAKKSRAQSLEGTIK
jgi:hypothetical protein